MVVCIDAMGFGCRLGSGWLFVWFDCGLIVAPFVLMMPSCCVV